MPLPIPRVVRTAIVLVAGVACALAAGAAHADFRGRVVAVADGDTLTVLVDRTPVRVRLAGIDAPERGQPFADASRRSLASLVASRDVDVRDRGRDRYGRVLGVVVAGDVDANAEQVRRGYAWVFRRYAHDATLLALEADARAAGRGLWRERDPVPPWAWRARARPGATAGIAPVAKGDPS